MQTSHVTAYKATVCQQPDCLVIRKRHFKHFTS